METSSLTFYLFHLLNSLLILGAHGVHIQFYKHPNFTGLFWEGHHRSRCSSGSAQVKAEVYSIRTDKCLIAHGGGKCKSFWSEKFMPGDIILSKKQFGEANWIKSTETCNEEEGGNQLNLDISGYFDHRRSERPDVSESYKNVCSCVNIPRVIQNTTWLIIDNHHNDLLAYYEPDCSVNKWNATFIKAGHNDYSRWVRDHEESSSLRHIVVVNSTYSVKAFGPDPNSTYFQTSCKSPNATNQSTDQYERTTKGGLDVTHDKSIFESEALMNSVKKIWSYSKKGDTSLPKSNWTCMSCFDD